MSKIYKLIAKKIVPALSIALAIALALAAMIGTAGATTSNGTVTVQGDANVEFPPDVQFPAGTTVHAVPAYDFGTINITGQAITVGNTNETPYIRVKDLRGTKDGWSLDYTISPFVNQSLSSNLLVGASLQIVTNGTIAGNIQTVTTGGSVTAPGVAVEHVPVAVGELSTITTGNVSPVLSNQKNMAVGGSTAGTQGSAKCRIATATQSSQNQGVGEWWIPTRAILTIPQAADLRAANYQATIQWYLNNTPT